jgi:lysozyme
MRYSEAKEFLIKEAGWKENIATSLMAAILMILSGSNVQAASKRTKIPETTINLTLQDPTYMDQARKMQKRFQMNPKTQNVSAPTVPSMDEIFDFIKRNEGYSNKAYKDPAGNMAIGVGFNMDRPFSKKAIENLGLNYYDVRNGVKSLSNNQVKILFNDDAALAIKNAKLFVNNFDSLPHDAKLVLIDMSYNMGLPRLSKFKDFKAALENMDFKNAAKEMQDSKWYNQVKSRGTRMVSMMTNIPSTTTIAQIPNKPRQII